MVKSKNSKQKEIRGVEDNSSLTTRDRMFLMVAIIIVLGLLIIFSQKSDISIESAQPISGSEYETNLELESNLDHGPDIGISVLTDKEVYHSEEIMEITVLIETTEDLPDSEIYLYGIETRRGPRLEMEEDADIETGTTAISFEYTTPKCYGCAGISEGTYNINVELMDENGTLANATTEIEILK